MYGDSLVSGLLVKLGFRFTAILRARFEKKNLQKQKSTNYEAGDREKTERIQRKAADLASRDVKRFVIKMSQQDQHLISTWTDPW